MSKFGVRAAAGVLLIALAGSGLAETTGVSSAAGAVSAAPAGALEQVQKYERAIHVMAMLLVGFGFLMVFVRKYGRAALTATYLLVGVSIPAYFILDTSAFFGEKAPADIDRLLLAEFGAASLLICAGAVLGRLRMWQYMVLAAVFVPCYMANEWIVLKHGLGLLPAGEFLDTGGSIVIHAFGALFGLGAIIPLTSRNEFDVPIESDSTSDRYSLLGSMVLWIFWPSFCGALSAPGDVPHTAINVIFALCGSTLATYFATVLLRRKISPADIANASLAGGVAIGSTCASENFYGMAFVIGLCAGALSTFGFAVIQPRLQGWLKKADTCGVLYLHGLPGLLGGLAGLLVTRHVRTQALGILFTAIVALLAGHLTGHILSVLGRRAQPYSDEPEILVEATESTGALERPTAA